MNNLSSLDTETLCYFIENKISPQDYGQLLLEGKQKQLNTNQYMMEEGKDE